MFEKLVEGIIQRFAGAYIEGFDPKNLNIGIWSGNVLIENVSLKKSIFDTLKMPLRMKFSHIGKIAMKVPWKNLANSPLEITLDGVYVNMGSLPQNEWNFTNYQDTETKVAVLREYALDCLAKMAEAFENRDKQGEDSDSFTSRLLVKIIDNVQVTVRNIHVRFENDLNPASPFSVGLCLEEVLMYTTNAKWQREFVDRTQPAHRGESLYKQLILSNLGLYWNNDERRDLQNMEKEVGKRGQGEIYIEGS